MTLQDYTTEELRAELKRRSDLAKVEIGEEALCAVIDYCNCGICTKSGKCQLSLQHMCLRGRAFYDGFIKGAKISKGGEK